MVQCEILSKFSTSAFLRSEILSRIAVPLSLFVHHTYLRMTTMNIKSGCIDKEHQAQVQSCHLLKGFSRAFTKGVNSNSSPESLQIVKATICYKASNTLLSMDN